MFQRRPWEARDKIFQICGLPNPDPEPESDESDHARFGVKKRKMK